MRKRIGGLPGSVCGRVSPVEKRLCLSAAEWKTRSHLSVTTAATSSSDTQRPWGFPPLPPTHTQIWDWPTNLRHPTVIPTNVQPRLPLPSLLSSSWGQEKLPAAGHISLNVHTVNWRDSWGAEAVTWRPCEKLHGRSPDVGFEWSWSRLLDPSGSRSCRFRFPFFYYLLFCLLHLGLQQQQSWLSLRRRCIAPPPFKMEKLHWHHISG